MKILIAVDESPESQHAVDVAFDYFGADHDYVVLSVQEPYPMLVSGYGPAGFGSAALLRTQLDDTLTNATASNLERAQEHLPVQAETESVLGNPGRAICDAAEEHACQLIVIGSQDKTFWDRLFDPSVGRFLVDNAPCPVLVVR